MIDTTRGEPVVVEKHSRPVVAIEEYERLKEIEHWQETGTNETDGGK